MNMPIIKWTNHERWTQYEVTTDSIKSWILLIYKNEKVKTCP